MSKINLTDLTFTIPVKIESKDRFRNFKNCVKWLRDHYDTNIIIFEADSDKRLNVKVQDHRARYYFHYNTTFHRTRYLNEMTKLANTPFVANYDIDVLFKPKQLEESMNLLREGKLDGVFPYDGYFIDMRSETIDKVIKKNSLDGVKPSEEKIIGYDVNAAKTAKGVAKVASVGGCVIWNKEKFIEGGMENENFVSYGFEDIERVERFEKLGYNLGRVHGHLYHMSHSRGPDSFVTHDHYQSNQKECQRIKELTKKQLKKEIETWSWTQNTNI